jgi:hypothetical protein
MPEATTALNATNAATSATKCIERVLIIQRGRTTADKQ